jgi:hypothetical protein
MLGDVEECSLEAYGELDHTPSGSVATDTNRLDEDQDPENNHGA